LTCLAMSLSFEDVLVVDVSMLRELTCVTISVSLSSGTGDVAVLNRGTLFTGNFLALTELRRGITDINVTCLRRFTPI